METIASSDFPDRPVVFLYANCSLGGVGAVLQERVRTVRAEGLMPHLLFQRDAGAKEALLAAGASSVTIPETPLHSSIVIRLAQRIGAKHIVLLSHYEFASVLRAHGMRVVAEYHGGDGQALYNLAQNITDEPVVVPSLWTKRIISRALSSNRSSIHVYPNRVRPPGGEPDAVLHIDNRKHNIVWVGRLGDEQKNWRDAVTISAHVAENMRAVGLDVAVRLIVSWQNNEHIVRGLFDYASQAGLSDFNLYFNLAPGVFDRLFAHWGRRNSVFLSTSTFESFGLAAAQALVSGMRVVLGTGGTLEELANEAGEKARLFRRGEVLEAAKHCMDFLGAEEPPDDAFCLRLQQSFERRWEAGTEAYMAFFKNGIPPAWVKRMRILPIGS